MVRTNCIDCLDRTNVVQGLLGRKHLEAVLARAQLGTQGAALEVSFPQVRLMMPRIMCILGHYVPTRSLICVDALLVGYDAADLYSSISDLNEWPLIHS